MSNYSDREWQQHVITIKGQEVITQALDGQLRVEIPSVYLAYIPELEILEIPQFAEYLRTVTQLPASNKVTDIIDKSVVQNKTLISIQVDNVGMRERFKYNAIIVMIKDRQQRIIPYTISAIKTYAELPPETQPTKLEIDLLTLLSSSADVQLTINPKLSANRVRFDNAGTNLTATDVQSAIVEVNNDVRDHKNQSILTGIHNLKYDKNANKFNYYEGNRWNPINVAGTQITDANSKIEAEKQKLTQLTTTVNAEKQKLTQLTNTVNDTGGRIDRLTTSVNGETDRLNQLSTTVTAEQGKLTTLTGTVNTARQNITQNAQALTTHEGLNVTTSQGVHGMRYHDGKLQVKVNNNWDITLGVNVPPKDVSDISVIGNDRALNIKWTDPSNLTIDGALLSKWVGTKVVYKTGSYPTNANDGTLIVNNTTRNQYQTNGYNLTGLTNGTTYYISFFPYNTNNTYNTNEQNRITGTPSDRPKVPPNPVTGTSIKVGNTQLTIKWTDPIDKADATWQKTRVVYKTGGYPTDANDGTLVVESTTRDQYKTNGYNLTGLTNGTEYYFTFFAYSVEGGINKDVQIKKTPQAYRIMTVRINQANSNPEQCCTYEDDAINMTPGSPEWDDFFGHFPCLFKAGEIVGRLNPKKRTLFEDGRTADISSGREGDVMIAVPRNKSKMVTIGNEVLVSVTDDLSKGDGFDDLAHRRSNDPKDYFFIGAYQGSVIDGKLRSLAGKTPRTNITIGQARNYARANGTGYDQLAFYQLTYLQAIYILKYKNLNSQQAVGRGYVDGNSAVLNTGGTETKGMDWGENTGKQHMVLFGLEDFWGNVFQWIDGLYCDAQRNILTATDKFNDTGSGYTNQGKGANANIYGYISDVQGSTKTGFIAKTCGGSETTHYADYSILSASCLPAFGGSWNDGSYAGAFSPRVVNSASDSSYNVGARLMYL